jgi:hypothetical protein
MNCPICGNRMSQIKVAPCYDCGHDETEIDEFKNHEHEYHLFTIFDEKIILCDFCDADFDSYDPEYLGLPEGSPMDYPMTLIEKIEDPKMEKDFFCPDCKHRLKFLDFLKNIRKKNST